VVARGTGRQRMCAVVFNSRQVELARPSLRRPLPVPTENSIRSKISDL
jgi:hypothetical protein